MHAHFMAVPFHSFDFAGISIEVRTAYDNVEKWTKTQRAEFNLNFFALCPKMKAEPKGVVLNITPFNVPVFMILSPLVFYALCSFDYSTDVHSGRSHRGWERHNYETV